MKKLPINCEKCGRFVGKNGLIIISEDYYLGGHDLETALCKRCLDEQNEEEKQAGEK